MKMVDKNNRIFSSEEFQKDKYKFNLILQNLNSENLELYSDEENYIVCRGSKEWPTWIWTKDNITFDVVKKIESVIDLYLTDKEKDKFTCKKYLYDQLKDDGYDKLNLDDYFEMDFLICNNPVKPKVCDGYIDIPTEKDKQLLIKYRFEDYKEMVIVDDISIEKAKTDVENEYSDNKLYVWRNSDGKIVSFASYRVTGNQAKMYSLQKKKEKNDMRQIWFMDLLRKF